jgi:hypothetical protein
MLHLFRVVFPVPNRPAPKLFAIDVLPNAEPVNKVFYSSLHCARPTPGATLKSGVLPYLFQLPYVQSVARPSS